MVGSLMRTGGGFLLTRMTPSTSLLEAIIYIVIAGIGLGTFFSVLTLSAQNALPRTRLGVGTGAVRYLGQLGSVLGVAIVGTIVNTTLSSDIVKRVPAAVVQQLTPAGFKFATNKQELVNPPYRNTEVRTAESFAQKIAVAHVQPVPQLNTDQQSLARKARHEDLTMLKQSFISPRPA